MRQMLKITLSNAGGELDSITIAQDDSEKDELAAAESVWDMIRSVGLRAGDTITVREIEA